MGLDCAAPQVLFHHRGLNHIRALIERGCYGRLESVIPPITVPAWMSTSTSRDPGSLGVYGFRNRKDYSYHGLSMLNSSSIQQTAIWDVLGAKHKNVVVVGVPPSYSPTAHEPFWNCWTTIPTCWWSPIMARNAWKAASASTNGCGARVC
jgi:predicted AlkP superfamily phosphohydrolase/phosphomutase